MKEGYKEEKRQAMVKRFMTRREFLKRAGITAGAAAAAMSPLGIPRNAFAKETMPKDWDWAKGYVFKNKPKERLHFLGWRYHPEIVKDNTNKYNERYNENVYYELLPGEYHAAFEIKAIAGQKIDVGYSEEDRLIRWHMAGWIRELDDLPGAKELKASVYPTNLKMLCLDNGTLIGVPYYSSFISFVYNDILTEKAGFDKPPETFEEMMENCRKLKKDGISEYPYISAWERGWAMFNWQIFGWWYSEGAKVFDGDFNFVGADEPAFKRVLQWHVDLYKEELVLPDMFTLKVEGVPNFLLGVHTYMTPHEYDQLPMNDPKLSKIAGHVKNTLMPGKTHSTFAWVAAHVMGSKTKDVDRSWQFMRYLSWKIDGDWPVRKRWGLELGPDGPYPEYHDLPEIREGYAKWKDVEIAKKQIEISTPRMIARAPWFPEWDWFMMGECHDMIRGKQTVDQTTKKLADKARELKQSFT